MHSTLENAAPADRNSAIVALILKHLKAAGQPLEYTVLTSIVRDDTGLNEIQVNGTITNAIFTLIRGGMVKCSWHNEKRNRTMLGLGAMLWLSDIADQLMSETDGQVEDPDAPVYDSPETDDLVDQLGELCLNVLNFPSSGDTFLAFSFRPQSDISTENLEAAKKLIDVFHSNPKTRRAIIDVELGDGGGYVVATDCDLGFRVSDPA